MKLERRREWVSWRLSLLGDAAPPDSDERRWQVMFAIWLQVSPISDDKNRLEASKKLFDVNWKRLSRPTQAILKDMNAGKCDLYCKHCRMVLLPEQDKYCSPKCAKEYCQICEHKMDSRMVVDGEKTRLQNLLREPLKKMISFLQYEEELKVDLADRNRLAMEKARTKTCCAGNFFIIDDRLCAGCKAHHWNFKDVLEVERLFKTKAVTWSECKAAQRMLGSIPRIIEKAKKFCPMCNPVKRERQFEESAV
jgi:hypothetical protein